jgi:hypothetical protein
MVCWTEEAMGRGSGASSPESESQHCVLLSWRWSSRYSLYKVSFPHLLYECNNEVGMFYLFFFF